MAYAEHTTVAVETSMAEIVGMVRRSGADRIAQIEEPGRLTIEFFARDRRLRFHVDLPDWEAMPKVNGRNQPLDTNKRRELAAQRARQRARALMLVIKAKLESVESGVETFEQAFLANVVMPGGETVYERIQEPIALEYASGKVALLLLSSRPA